MKILILGVLYSMGLFGVCLMVFGSLANTPPDLTTVSIIGMICGWIGMQLAFLTDA